MFLLSHRVEIWRHTGVEFSLIRVIAKLRTLETHAAILRLSEYDEHIALSAYQVFIYFSNRFGKQNMVYDILTCLQRFVIHY